MKSIVIPLSETSKNNYKELNYAIRSLQLNLNCIGDIFIVGKKTSSLNGFKWIRCHDDTSSKFKERNIYRKILAACNHPDVSEDFIFTNDDIYLRNSFDVDNLPFYHKGDLLNTMSKNRGDYRKSLNHTRKYLLSNDKSTLDFDTHFPIVYNKKKFFDTFVCKSLNWDIPFGYVIKSIYCNMNGIEGEFGGDCKVQEKLTYEQIKAKVNGRSFFSTSDGSINDDMIRFLEEQYPTI